MNVESRKTVIPRWWPCEEAKGLSHTSTKNGTVAIRIMWPASNQQKDLSYQARYTRICNGGLVVDKWLGFP